MDRWRGKIAVVTGAACGIGAATAEKLANAGVKVIGVDVLVEKVENLKKCVKGEIVAVKCDLRNESEIAALFDFVKAKFGVVHILINAAGFGRYGLLSDGNIQFFKEIFDVNVIAGISCTQKALKLMKDSSVDDGHIIYINSIGGHQVHKVSCEIFNVYQASKHSITALTETLRQELVYLKSKIRVSSISPGNVKTDFCANFLANSGIKKEDVDWKVFEGIPKLEPGDVADAILFVLSAPPHVQVHDVIIKPVGERW